MASFRLTSGARDDLRNAFRYVAQHGGIPVARRLRLRIRDRFVSLAEQPFIGRSRPEFGPELRSHAVPGTRYIIFYYPRDYGVEIVRVIQGSQRLTSLFEQ